MKIGIIGAMESEIELLLSKMTNKKSQIHATRTFYEGELLGKEIVLVQSGIGKVNAGIVTQMMITRYGVSYIINTGIAGSLDAGLDIGDIVVSTDAVYHDVEATEFGYQRGQVPGLDVQKFVASSKLLSLIPEKNHIKKGTVTTGDQFINNHSIKKDIKTTFGGMCVEMEGAAIGQTCYLNGVEFLIIRSISDNADEEAVEDYPMNEALAVERATEITEAIIKQL